MTSWEGVTKRRGRFGTTEFRFGRFSSAPCRWPGSSTSARSSSACADAYERAQDVLDRGAGVTA